jgi:mannose-6-phosphate isomerase-like protein (cupin superfamily)
MNGSARFLAAVTVLWILASMAGAIAQAPQAGSGDSRTLIIQKAPADRTVAMPKEQIAQYFKDMDAKQLQTLRMLEGGKYNVNIRRITAAETALVHPNTIDLWVVLEGSGTLTSGGTIQNGKIVGGQSHTIKAGDVEFIPPTIAHGVSGVQGSLTWLNIRWDTDWK